jgi:hypothetical protein
MLALDIALNQTRLNKRDAEGLEAGVMRVLTHFLIYRVEKKMKLISLKKSGRRGKKYVAVLEDGLVRHTVHFGAAGYTDFTINKSEEKKAAYIARHQVTEDWDDPRTAGFWSRWLLWNKPTLRESLADLRRRFRL